MLKIYDLQLFFNITLLYSVELNIFDFEFLT